MRRILIYLLFSFFLSIEARAGIVFKNDDGQVVAFSVQSPKERNFGLNAQRLLRSMAIMYGGLLNILGHGGPGGVLAKVDGTALSPDSYFQRVVAYLRARGQSLPRNVFIGCCYAGVPTTNPSLVEIALKYFPDARIFGALGARVPGTNQVVPGDLHPGMRLVEVFPGYYALSKRNSAAFVWIRELPDGTRIGGILSQRQMNHLEKTGNIPVGAQALSTGQPASNTLRFSSLSRLALASGTSMAITQLVGEFVGPGYAAATGIAIPGLMEVARGGLSKAAFGRGATSIAGGLIGIGGSIIGEQAALWGLKKAGVTNQTILAIGGTSGGIAGGATATGVMVASAALIKGAAITAAAGVGAVAAGKVALVGAVAIGGYKFGRMLGDPLANWLFPADKGILPTIHPNSLNRINPNLNRISANHRML